MNVLLTYPEYPDTFFSFKHSLHFVSRKAALASSWFNHCFGSATTNVAKKTGIPDD